MSPLWKLALRILALTAIGLVAAGGLFLQYLSREAPPPVHPEISPRLGHSSSVWSVAWSPDGKLLASGSIDHTLKLWDASSGELLRTLSGHSGAINAVAWSPDGRTLASGSWDNTVKLWDASSGNLLRTLSGHSSYVLSLAWSPDGSTLASGSRDTTLMLWNASSGELLHTLSGHSDRASAVAWSPDGKTLASGSYDKSLKLWDASSGNLRRTLSGHSGWIESVTWSPDGSTLASGSADDTVTLWDASTGSLLRTLFGHSSGISSVTWSPDGRALASGCFDNTLKLWDASSGNLLRTLSGHSDVIFSVAWSPDGRTLASGSQDKSLKIWDASSGNLLRTLSGHSSEVASVAWSPDGRYLASGGREANIRFWDSSSGRLLRTLHLPPLSSGSSDWVLSVAWSPDGNTLASSSLLDSAIKLWHASTGENPHSIRERPPTSPLDFSSVHAVAWSPDGKTLASGGEDHTLKLWDTSSGKLLRTLSAHSQRVGTVAWSPDGKLLASGSYDKTLKLWDASSGELLRTLSGHSSEVRSVAWSPDGRFLASGSYDKTLKLWDASSGNLLRTLLGHSSYVLSVAWSPNGKLLASGSDDNTLKLWDASSGELLRTLFGHSSPVTSVAWSPDGKTLASGSEDGSVALWQSTGELERLSVALPGNVWLTYHPTKLLYVSSPDGDSLAAVRFDSRTTPVYPLAYYRAELQRSELSPRSSEAPPPIAPEPFRQAWERFENKPLWLGGVSALYLLGFALALVLVQRRDPMELARRFFLRAGFTRVEQVSQGRLSLSPERDGRRAHALLWQEDWQPLARQFPPRQGTSTTAPRIYLIYAGRVPESAQLQAFRAQVGGEIIPLPTSTLAFALSENTCPSALQEAEDRFVTRTDPYYESTPVDDPAWFHGRAELLDRLPTALLQGQHVGLFGLRKVGKTSLIKQLRNRAQETPIVEIDCQSYEPVALDYLQIILEKTYAELRRLKVHGLPALRKLQSAGEFRGQFLELHGRWIHSGRSGPILLFLDEIDKLFVDRRRANSEAVLGEYVRLLRPLRALAQEHRCLAMLVAAYRSEVSRQNMLTDAVGENPMFMSFQEHFLGALSTDEAQTMIREIGLWRNIHWESAALVELHTLCGGHPFLTRLLASEACEQGASTQVDLARVQQAAAEVQSHFRKNRIGRYYQESIWDVLLDDERQALQSIAAQEAGIERSALPAEFEEALIQLEHFGIIRQEAGKLRVSARLFQQWMAHGGYA